VKWVTRAGLHVDRTACAWLIRRFIDADAEFLFIIDPADLPPEATPFDIPGHAFSHHDGDSTFEVMARHYRIDHPGVRRIGRIIHEADIEDERYDAPEAPGLDAIVRGLAHVLGDDTRLIETTSAIYDGLLATLRPEEAEGSATPI
jgi:hypothetical protein